MDKNAGMQNVRTLHTGCSRNLRQETQENQFSFTGFRYTHKNRDRERGELKLHQATTLLDVFQDVASCNSRHFFFLFLTDVAHHFEEAGQ